MYLWLLDDESLINAHHKSKFIREKYPEIYKEFKSITFPEKLPFSQLFWHFINDDPELKLGLCPVCGNRCRFKNLVIGYRHHCSPKCFWEDKKFIELYKKKLSDIQNNKSDNEKKMIIEKRECTNKKKFGKNYYSQTKDWKNSVNKTCLEKYGYEFYQHGDDWKKSVKNTWSNKSDEELLNHKNRIKITSQERYGVDNYSSLLECRKKVIKANQERYGVDNYAKTDECIEKMKNTCLERYGVENYAQTSEFLKFHKKRVKYDGLTFDSSWEVIVYQYCKKYNKNFEYQPNVKLEYEYDNKKHYYQPDFLIDGQLYEVKGDQFFECDKMINPYNRDQDELIESKYQCMIKNNVIILRRDDIKRIKEML